MKETAEKYNQVIFAILFGSIATDEQSPISDIDIAVYVDETKVDDLFKFQLKLLGAFNDCFKTDEIDLVILNEAPPALKYEIIKKGILVFCRNENVYDEFYLRAMKEYFDFYPILKKNYEHAKQKLRRKVKNRR
ncbi:MAG: type VII toxin-antitoxin system MntA family adenylyltransferase antitoxin [Candidatus Asgardarchaeia archaeon]